MGPRFIVVAGVLLVFLVPAWFAAGHPVVLPSELAEKVCADSEEAPTEEIAPVSPLVHGDGVDDAELRRLHDALAHLAGFVDVHFILQGPPRFVAYFAGPVPGELPDVGAPHPMTAESIVEVEESTHDAAVDPPLIPSVCTGIRPGTSLSGCTWAWKLVDDANNTYMTTAGHCVGGPGARVGSVGTVVFRMASGIGNDFAVVRIDPEDAVNTRGDMCHWGGPTDEAGSGTDGALVRQYGFGFVFGSTQFTRPRSGWLTGVGANSFTYVGPQVSGDSGSPVRHDAGPALGVHTHGSVSLLITTAPGIKYGTRLVHGLDVAEAATGIDFHLVTAPVA